MRRPHSVIRLEWLPLIVGLVACGADRAGAPALAPTVVLTATPDHVTMAGDIALTASVTAHGTPVRQVEFYQRIGGDTSTIIGVQTAPPYTFSVAVPTADENDTRYFVAKVYDVAGRADSSNTVTVAVKTVDTRPLEATFSVQSRITSLSPLVFAVGANKLLAKLEVYQGETKLAEVDAPEEPYQIAIELTSANNGTQSYLVRATDAIGNVVASAPLSVVVDILWDSEAVLDGASRLGPVHITTDAQTAVYVAGGFPVTTSDYDLAVAKFDGNGNQQWLRTFGGSGTSEVAGSLGIDPAGRPYVVGCSGTDTSPIETCYVLIYDASGALVRTIPTQDGAVHGGFDAAGNLYTAGTSSDTTGGRAFVAKYDPSGALVWTRKFRSAENAPVDYAREGVLAMTVDAAGHAYLAAGTSGSAGIPLVLEYDSDGNRLWARQFDSTGVAFKTSTIRLDPAGGLYLAGGIWQAGDWSTSADAVLIRFEPNGAVGWVRTLDGGGMEWGTDVASDASGVYLIGYAQAGDTLQDFSEPRSSEMGFVARYDRDGNRQWIRMSNVHHAEASLDPNGNLWLVGEGHVGTRAGDAIARLRLRP